MKTVKYLIFIGTGVFLVSNSDFIKLIKNHFKLHELKKQSVVLDRNYDNMKREKKLLDTSDRYLEKFAGCQLHLTKPNEYEFRFTPPKEKENDD